MNKNLDMAMASGVAQGVPGLLMNMMLQQQQMFMQMTGRGQDAEVPGFQIFKPNNRGQKRPQLALGDQPAAAQPATAPAVEPSQTQTVAAAAQAAPEKQPVPIAAVHTVATPQQQSVLQLPAVTPEPANDLPQMSAEDQANAV